MGIPAAGVALLLGVDRILDMCRTAINVLGDVVMCCVTDRFISETDLDDENADAAVETG